MKYSLSQKNIMSIAISIALVLSLGRLVKSHFDSSYFIVAGSDFVDAAKTPSSIIVQPGQGYDGQFFYRYALNPFNLNNNIYGINVDLPAYRVQRIAYPFFAWLLSFCGTAYLVPWAMLFLNILAFAGIFFYNNKFIAFLNGDIKQGLLPLFLCGLYMSLSRDLSEIVELFFFTGAVYYLFTSRYLWFSIFTTLTILSRETAIIALAPLATGLFIRGFKKDTKMPPVLYLGMPFLIFVLWKLIIFYHMPSVAEEIAGYRLLGVPFNGLLRGFRENLNFSTTKNILQFLFWIAYLSWTVSLVTIVLRNNSFKALSQLGNLDILKIIYLAWLIFAVCFSDKIYCDDWSFVRVFSLWNMVGFMIMIAGKKRTGSLFNSFSAVLALLTIIRLMIRV